MMPVLLAGTHQIPSCKPVVTCCLKGGFGFEFKIIWRSYGGIDLCHHRRSLNVASAVSVCMKPVMSRSLTALPKLPDSVLWRWNVVPERAYRDLHSQYVLVAKDFLCAADGIAPASPHWNLGTLIFKLIWVATHGRTPHDISQQQALVIGRLSVYES